MHSNDDKQTSGTSQQHAQQQQGEQQGFVDDAPRYARPEQQGQQLPQQQVQHEQQQWTSDRFPTPQQEQVQKQQQQQQEQEAVQQTSKAATPAAQQQEPQLSIQQWQYKPPPSNVVEIDEVEVTPIDDPFYDPSNPSSNFDRSSRDREASTAAAFGEHSGTAGVQHPSSNAVAIDDVDFEGFAAPLLEEGESGGCLVRWLVSCGTTQAEAGCVCVCVC